MMTVPEMVLGWLEAAFKTLGEGDRKVVVHLETPRAEHSLGTFPPDRIDFEHMFAVAKAAGKKTVKGDARLHFIAEVGGVPIDAAMTIVVTSDKRAPRQQAKRNPPKEKKVRPPPSPRENKKRALCAGCSTVRYLLYKGYCRQCRREMKQRDSSNGGMNG